MSVPTQSLPIDAKTLIAEVEKQTTAAVSAMQGKLLTEIAKAISDAVDKKYTVVVGRRLGTETSEAAHAPAQESRTREPSREPRGAWNPGQAWRAADKEARRTLATAPSYTKN